VVVQFGAGRSPRGLGVSAGLGASSLKARRHPKGRPTRFAGIAEIFADRVVDSPCRLA